MMTCLQPVFPKIPIWGFFTLKIPKKLRISHPYFWLHSLILCTCNWLYFLCIWGTGTLSCNPLISAIVGTLIQLCTIITGQFGVSDMMTILRDENSNINLGYGTTGSQVSCITSGAAASTKATCHWLTATPMPTYSMFKPFIFTPNADIGKLTVSPDYGDQDPAKIKPRFGKFVNRDHELWAGHMKVTKMLDTDNDKALRIFANVSELEKQCIADVEEMLEHFNESCNAKYSSVFSHMSNLELNFYK